MQYGNENIICPFFQNEISRNGHTAIICEGVGICQSIRQNFKSAAESRYYVEIYCAKDYEKCRLFKIINDDYKE